MKKRVVFLTIVALLAMAFCVGAQAAVCVKANASSVTLGLTKGVNDTYQLTLKLSNGKTAQGASFVSSNESVVDVSADGLLTAHSYGVAVVTANCDGAKSARIAVKVTSIRAKGLKLNKKRMTLTARRDSGTLTATITPATVDSDAVTWSSTKPEIASVDAFGVVTPLKPGKTKIICRTTDGSRLSRSCVVTVKAVIPESVELEEGEKGVIGIGETKTLHPRITPADADNQTCGWRSSNAKIAKVTAAGVVQGVAPGTATITCRTKSGGKVCKYKVTVGYSNSDVNVFVIGQSDYQDPDLRLPACKVDADDVEKAFRGLDIGQKSLNVVKKTNLTCSGILSLLNSISTSYGIDKNDVTYIYYSGHGCDSYSKIERGAWVGVDFDYDDRIVTVNTIKKYLDRVPGKVVLISDSCLSGQFLRSKSAAAARVRADLSNSAFVSEFAGYTVAPGAKSTTTLKTSKYQVLVACQPMESSFTAWFDEDEDNDHSVFTYVLCQMIADMSEYDADDNGLLSVREAWDVLYPVSLEIILEITDGEYQQRAMCWPTNSTFPIYGQLSA